MKKKIYFWRIVHAIAAAYLVFCVYVLYNSTIKGENTFLTYLALTSLVMELILVALNNWECPLNPIHDRLGDEKRLFGLFIPKTLIPYGLPLLLVVGVGIFLFWILS